MSFLYGLVNLVGVYDSQTDGKPVKMFAHCIGDAVILPLGVLNAFRAWITDKRRDYSHVRAVMVHVFD